MMTFHHVIVHTEKLCYMPRTFLPSPFFSIARLSVFGGGGGGSESTLLCSLGGKAPDEYNTHRDRTQNHTYTEALHDMT